MINLNKSEKYRVIIYATVEFMYTYISTKEFKPYIHLGSFKRYVTLFLAKIWLSLPPFVKVCNVSNMAPHSVT